MRNSNSAGTRARNERSASSSDTSGVKRWLRFATSSSGTMFRARPARSVVTCSVSTNSTPCSRFGCGATRVISTSHSAARSIALTPVHGRAL